MTGQVSKSAFHRARVHRRVARVLNTIFLDRINRINKILSLYFLLFILSIFSILSIFPFVTETGQNE